MKASDFSSLTLLLDIHCGCVTAFGQIFTYRSGGSEKERKSNWEQTQRLDGCWVVSGSSAMLVFFSCQVVESSHP